MKIKTKTTFNILLSLIMAVTMIVGILPTFPAITAYAQTIEHRDPAEHWLQTGNRTSELDINARLTDEIQYCHSCNQETLFRVYRVPEFTRSGTTALNRGVLFSDGTMIDGINRGNLDAGLPGVNAFYTGYHWTKSVCRTCGTLNGNTGADFYSFGRNVYSLYDCAAGFMVDFNETRITPFNNRYHTEITRHGQFCQFCHGTHATTTQTQRRHRFNEEIDPQLGHHRFDVRRDCVDCDHSEREVLTAKTVVASHFGVADGNAHTIRLYDLSDWGVNTSVRFGHTATNTNMTSAPNFVAPGFHSVFYSVTFNYGFESMTRNGVAYVHLFEPTNTGNPSGGCTHDFRYLNTIPPTCTNLGFENWQCRYCGALVRRNYRAALGHDHRAVVIREPSCTRTGLTLHMCTRCGDFREETTPKTAHNFEARIVPPTCNNVGYTENRCADCGHTFITNIVPLIPHRHIAVITPPTCTERGYTTNTCEHCGDRFIDNFTEARGHRWNAGEILTTSTCEGAGVIIYTCLDCGDTKLQAVNANGHRPGAAANCTEPQRCLDCDAILQLPTEHTYTATIIPPTCISMGYTIFECIYCGDSFTSDFTDRLPHNYVGVVVPPTCTEQGFTVFTCADCGDTFTGDFVAALGHNYIAEIIPPTCREMGFTVFTCERCGDTFNGDFAAALGHLPSNWIIETPATLETDGLKYIECLRCGEILQTAVIPRLRGESYTDNNGEANVGGFIVIVTDSNAAPVPHARVTIDIDNNIGVFLPNWRLLDYADQTTVTALYAADEMPAQDLRVTVTDRNDNAAIGVTDEAGQVIVPDSETSTGDNGNGTIGGGDEKTFVVTVTDRNGDIVDNCEISIDEYGVISVTLPQGEAMDRENPITVTVTDQHGTPQENIDIVVVDEDGNYYYGTTNSLGRVTVPQTDRGYTNEDGRIQVNGYIVIVEDTENPIARAFVANTEENRITVLLPRTHTLTIENQVTITILLAADETPVEGMQVTVSDFQNRIETDLTDEYGQITVPPLPPNNSGYTDEDGNVTVNGYNVNVRNTQTPIKGAYVVLTNSGAITVTLPAPYILDGNNQTTVTVTSVSDNSAVSGRSVTVTDHANRTATRNTDTNGRIIVPDRPPTGGGGGGGSWGGGGGSWNPPPPPPTPTITHTAYILGYPDNTFRPENSMTRAEAAAIFARILADSNNERISGAASFPDVTANSWYTQYIGYLRRFGIIVGFPDGLFRPHAEITRAEFVTMAARFYAEYSGRTAQQGNNNPFSDVTANDWAISNIRTAVYNGWIVGYADGTFRGDNNITRSEVVTIVNRVLGRVADRAFINSNISVLIRFNDVSRQHWAFYDIMEAANTHDIIKGAANETWTRVR